MLFDVHTHKFDKNNQAIWNWRLRKHNDLELFESDPNTRIDPTFPFYSIGVHPWDAANFDEQSLKELKTKATNKNCLAIGEIGLDKTLGPSLSVQIDAFTIQAQLADELKLPVILHCVRSWNEVQKIKKQLKPNSPWIFHGFSKVKLLDQVIESGCFISIGAAILSNRSLRASIDQIPMEKLLLETDDKDLPIEMIYQEVAFLKKMEMKLIEEQIEKNFKTIFAKWTIG